MFAHTLLTLYRSLTRHRLYASLNVLGLALGVAVFLVLFLDVRYETSFEQWLPRANSIYVLRTSFTMAGFPGQSVETTMGAILEELQSDFPQLVGVFERRHSLTIREGGEATRADVALVGPKFFRIFDLPMVAGDKAHVLETPDEIVVSQSIAKHYFPAGNAMGRSLPVFYNGAVRNYRVTGVLKDPPQNTDRKFELIARMTPAMIRADDGWRRWDGVEVKTYLLLNDPKEAKALNEQLDAFVDRHASADIHRRDAHNVVKVRAEPLLDQHMSDPNLAKSVATLAAVGLLTLLVAGINYVNLATARAGVRAKEVALRKVAGAANSDLMVQYMFEAAVVALAGTLAGLALAEAALPLVNAASGLSLEIRYAGDQSVVPVLGAVVLIVSIGAGLYPALVLTRFRPAGVLASARTAAGGRTGVIVREILVTQQFVVATLFMISTAVIVSEVRLLHRGDVGFDRSRLIIVNSFSDPGGWQDITASKRSALFDLWRKIPGVVSITSSDTSPSPESPRGFWTFLRPGRAGDGLVMGAVKTGANFAATYGLRLKVGRLLSPEHRGDQLASSADDLSRRAPHRLSANVVVNVNAVRALGFANPGAALGQAVLEKADANGDVRVDTIAGVVENARFVSPREPIPPCVYYLQTTDFKNATATVRFNGVAQKGVMDQLHAIWLRVAPEAPFRAEGLETSRQEYYQAEEQHGRLFALGAGLAVMVACLGLYGLASSTTERRTREIGIRRTLGASVGNVLGLLLSQFMRPVLIATCVAWPLAYVASRNWLLSFDQRITLTPVYFLGATFLAVVIAMATVAGQAIGVAKAEPAKALRYE